LETPNKHH
jgi:serine/threonine protein phosphatase PrpC